MAAGIMGNTTTEDDAGDRYIPDLEVNEELAREHLYLLSGSDDPQKEFTFFAIDDRKKEPKDPNDRKPSFVYRAREDREDPPPQSWCNTFNESRRRIARLNRKGAGIFVCIHEMDGSGERAAENFVAVRACVNDLDHGEPPKSYPTKPSFSIKSSKYGRHDYFLLKDAMSAEEYRAVQDVLADQYGGDNQVKEVTRVMRLAGTYHRKTDEPWLVTIEGPDGVDRYAAGELLKAFQPPESKRDRRNKSTNAALTNLALGNGKTSADEVRSMLGALPDDWWEPRENWVTIGQALHHWSNGSDEGRELWCEYASVSDKFDERDAWRVWRSFSAEGSTGTPITLATLVKTARDHGWVRYSPPEVALPPDGTTASQFGRGIKEWTKDKTDAMLTRMNQDHALVSIGNKIRYLHRTVDAEGRPDLRFLLNDDMARLYANVVIDKNGSRLTTAFDEWNRWRKRLQYEGIGMFPPGARVPPGYLNLWLGFAIEACEGDWSLFRQHLHKIVCSNDEELFSWLMDWLAHLFQKPHEKPGSAIVLRSAQKGAGKSMLLEFLRQILGVHVFTTSHAEHVVGKYNMHLARALVLGIDEGVWAGSKPAESVVKNLISEPHISIEQKYVDAVQMRNFTRLIFTGNENWMVPVGIDERRFLVLDIKNQRANDARYFDPIFRQMQNGGVEAMLHELMERKITSNLRQPPETSSLVEQRKHSLDGVDRWLWSVTQTGEFTNKETGAPVVLNREAETSVPRAVVIAAAKAACNQYEGRTIDVRLGSLLASVGVTSGRESIGKRRRTYIFPALPELAVAVRDELNV
jgi:hypothetical protein